MSLKRSEGCTRLRNTVLIPVVTGKENEKKFLYEALSNAQKAIVVFLIDQSSGLTANEMSSELQKTEALLEEIEKTIHSMGKQVKVYNEWGSIREKIPVIAQREKAKQIIVQKRGKLGIKQIEEIKNIGMSVREIS